MLGWDHDIRDAIGDEHWQRADCRVELAAARAPARHRWLGPDGPPPHPRVAEIVAKQVPTLEDLRFLFFTDSEAGVAAADRHFTHIRVSEHAPVSAEDPENGLEACSPFQAFSKGGLDRWEGRMPNCLWQDGEKALRRGFFSYVRSPYNKTYNEAGLWGIWALGRMQNEQLTCYQCNQQLHPLPRH